MCPSIQVSQVVKSLSSVKIAPSAKNPLDTENAPTAAKILPSAKNPPDTENAPTAPKILPNTENPPNTAKHQTIIPLGFVRPRRPTRRCTLINYPTRVRTSTVPVVLMYRSRKITLTVRYFCTAPPTSMRRGGTPVGTSSGREGPVRTRQSTVLTTLARSGRNGGRNMFFFNVS